MMSIPLAVSAEELENYASQMKLKLGKYIYKLTF